MTDEVTALVMRALKRKNDTIHESQLPDIEMLCRLARIVEVYREHVVECQSGRDAHDKARDIAGEECR